MVGGWSGFSIGPATGWILLAMAGCLVLGTLYRWWRVRANRRADDEEAAATMWSRLQSVRTWWLLYVVLVAVLAVGPSAVAPVMAAVSFLVLRETLTLARAEPWITRVSAASALLICGVWLVPASWLMPSLAWIAVGLGALFLGLETLWRLVLRRRDAEGRIESARAVGVAVALGTVGPVYALAAARLAQPVHHAQERLGWLVLLLVLTSLDDMSQAWFGRFLGHRLVSRGLAPKLSPKKTWEGLAGGLVATAAAAAVVGPMLVPLGQGPAGRIEAAVVGLALAVAGIAGDLSGSWLKRRAGVKDSDVATGGAQGQRLRLPGHGGFLDRFDSLTLTAPTLYVLAWLLGMP